MFEVSQQLQAGCVASFTHSQPALAGNFKHTCPTPFGVLSKKKFLEVAHRGYLYRILLEPAGFVTKSYPIVDIKKNKEKEKTKNWMIKTIEKSMNRMKSVLHFMKHKFKYYFN